MNQVRRGVGGSRRASGLQRDHRLDADEALVACGVLAGAGGHGSVIWGEDLRVEVGAGPGLGLTEVVRTQARRAAV